MHSNCSCKLFKLKRDREYLKTTTQFTIEDHIQAITKQNCVNCEHAQAHTLLNILYNNLVMSCACVYEFFFVFVLAEHYTS